MAFSRQRLSALFLATALLAAPAAFAQEAKTFRAVISLPIQTLDPQKSIAGLAGDALRTVFQTLTFVQSDGSVAPMLAQSWEIDPNSEGLQWIVKLKPNVVFHDGEPFNAAAVAANWKRLLDPKVPIQARSNINMITEVEAIDDLTVRFTTNRPFSGFPMAIGHAVSSIVSPKSIAAGLLDDPNASPAGTGPYRIARFTLPDELEVEKFDKYWGKTGNAEKLVFISRPDEQARMAAFLAGEADANFYVGAESRGRVEGSQDLRTEAIASIREFIVHLPMKVDALQDVRVRRALNHAIDRDQIVKSVFGGVAEPALSAIQPGVAGYEKLPIYTYDVDKAAALLKEAGWTKNANGVLEKDGKPFPTLVFMSGRGRVPNDARLAQVTAAYLNQIGIPTTLQIDEFATFYPAAMAPEGRGTRFVHMSWGFGQMDGAAFLCTVYGEGRPQNFGGYENPKVGEACGKIDNTFDAAERARLIAEATKMVYEDAPAIFLVVPSLLAGFNSTVKNLKLDAGENHLLWEVELGAN